MCLMVDDRYKAVKLFRQESGSGQNAGLKQFVQKILPTIEQPQKKWRLPCRTVSRRRRPNNGRPTRQVELPCRTQQPVKLRFETRGEERITGRREVQRIWRDLCGQLSVAVEQGIADIGINDVLAVGTI
jgi:hypothetical protein